MHILFRSKLSINYSFYRIDTYTTIDIEREKILEELSSSNRLKTEINSMEQVTLFKYNKTSNITDSLTTRKYSIAIYYKQVPNSL